MRVDVNPTFVTHTNDISVRFKTQKEDGELFATTADRSDVYLKAMLDSGRIRLETNLAEGREVGFELMSMLYEMLIRCAVFLFTLMKYKI